MYSDFACAFRFINETLLHDIRAVVVSATGKYFTAGIDLNFAGEIASWAQNDEQDAGRNLFSI